MFIIIKYVNNLINIRGIYPKYPKMEKISLNLWLWFDRTILRFHFFKAPPLALLGHQLPIRSYNMLYCRLKWTIVPTFVLNLIGQYTDQYILLINLYITKPNIILVLRLILTEFSVKCWVLLSASSALLFQLSYFQQDWQITIEFDVTSANNSSKIF